jgi:hypothetical protein
METSNVPPEESPAVAPPPSLGSCLVNVFAAPSEVFERLRPTPARTATWLVPAALLILVSWLGAALVLSQDSFKQQISDLQDKAIQQQVDNGKLTEDQAKQARVAAERFGDIGMVIGAYAGPVFAALLTPFWWGFLLWLIGAKLLKGTCPYLKAVEVAGLANMIAVLAAVLKTLLALVTGNLFAGPNPGLFIPNLDSTSTLHAVLLNLDLMTFWVLAIRGLGIAKVSGVSTGKAVGLALGFWVVMTGSLMGIGLAVQSIFSR